MKSKHIKGFSLAEMLVYIGILAFLLVVILNILSSLSKYQRVFKASSSVQNSGVLALERITREVRNATSIDVDQSIFNTSLGVLSLNSKDADDNDKNIQFLISTSTIIIKENGEEIGPLTLSNASVTSLKFFFLNGSTTDAIKTEITIESGTSTSYKSSNFYTTTVLRNSI